MDKRIPMNTIDKQLFINHVKSCKSIGLACRLVGVRLEAIKAERAHDPAFDRQINQHTAVHLPLKGESFYRRVRKFGQWLQSHQDILEESDEA